MRFILSILFITLLVKNTSAQIISTVAGNGTYGFSGDGGSATAAMLAHPEGVAIDPVGNLYICDNKCVRKVSPASGGTITTFAGVGTSTGYSGDGGPAYFARVSGVHDVAVDKYGNVYLADAGNNRVRKVTLDGIINTIAGTGGAGFNGDGIAATAAQLNSPYGVAIDDTGNIYIADSYNYRIRKINVAGIITTVTGTGISGFSGDGGIATMAQIHHPLSLDVDRNGNLYFTDSGRIRRIDVFGTINTVVGNGIMGFSGDGGYAISAEIIPLAIAVDTIGNLFIADDDRIRKVNTAGIISTIAGTGAPMYNGDSINPLAANIRPYGVFSDNNRVYIGDLINNRVRVISNSDVSVNSINDAAFGIRIIPNPSSSYCTVFVINQDNKQAQIRITNMLGIEVLRQVVAVNKDISFPTPWPPGVYVITANDENAHTVTEKVIVQ